MCGIFGIVGFNARVDRALLERGTQSLAHHRQIAMYVARETGRSLPFIGRCMGGRDHTTILHGRRAVQSRIDSGDTGTIAALVQIIERLTGKTIPVAGGVDSRELDTRRAPTSWIGEGD